LQLCLEKGAVFDGDLDEVAEAGAENPAMLNILLAVNWRNMQHSQPTHNHFVRFSASRDVKMLTWLLNHGAKVSRETIKPAALSGTPVATMALLVERCGVAALKDSCALQLAVGRGERDMVEFLLQVGADVEEMPAQLGDIRESGPFTALYEAVQGQHVEIVKLLLERGAKVDTPCGWPTGQKKSPLQAERRQGNSQIVSLLE
jgi:hypothetical protein